MRARCRSRDLRIETLCNQRLGARMLSLSTSLPTKNVEKRMTMPRAQRPREALPRSQRFE
ncbi:hypothetical protein C6T59_29990 [Burkholderia multivorans]|nr:hypothetical protein BURMUCGD1_3868 [Burkholderia multivorans CGD1]PRE99263.1 hypothetical protein C6Q01_22325 [Burkholderia multivorans]PRF31747.1 hypothetical protein C6Q10_30225 [Burkholderia multivorans]PRF90171.1 hypothetical protein C6Q23_12925 [Burkholderia multivorans]PRG59157.1 hypothetical protein C6T59_29990 [Burkholderia multivorans]